MARTKYDIWTVVNRREQCALGGVLVQDLRKLWADRNRERVSATYHRGYRGRNMFFSDTDPGPGVSQKVKNDALKGLRVYGKGVNQNRLVVRRIHWIRRYNNVFNTTKIWARRGYRRLRGECSRRRPETLTPFPSKLEKPFEPPKKMRDLSDWWSVGPNPTRLFYK